MLVPVINHLLAQESWARAKLAAHAGKVALIDAGAVVLRLQPGADGLLVSADAELPVDVSISVKMSDLPLIMQHRDRAFSYVTVAGDADFANSISQVAQNLRWEAEDDLAPWIGDIAATRVVSSAKSLLATMQSTGQGIAENVAEYLTEEKPLLMRTHSVTELGGEVNRMRDDVERLIKRIEKLESRSQ
jgi:ubiquinone biosynthesis protein UbiJ